MVVVVAFKYSVCFVAIPRKQIKCVLVYEGGRIEGIDKTLYWKIVDCGIYNF